LRQIADCRQQSRLKAKFGRKPGEKHHNGGLDLFVCYGREPQQQSAFKRVESHKKRSIAVKDSKTLEQRQQKCLFVLENTASQPVQVL